MSRAVHPELGRDTRLGTVARPAAARQDPRSRRAGARDRALRRRRRRRGRQGAALDRRADRRPRRRRRRRPPAAHRRRARGPLPARDHAARGRLRQGRGRADGGPGRLAEPDEGLARPLEHLRAHAARDRRAGDRRAGRGIGRAAWPRATSPASRGSSARVRGAARRHADAPGADPLPRPPAVRRRRSPARRGKRGRSLRTRLDLATQTAAETGAGRASRRARWSSSSPRPATCWRPPTARRTTSTARSRAAIRPGSTFKVVSTAALLRDGLDHGDRRRLPADDRGRGQVVSQLRGRRGRARCRSARTSRRAATPPSSRSPTVCSATTCRRWRCAFGLGEKLETGVPVADADVPAARDDVGQAAMMIGQDRILASPLAMAGVAATVAEGRWRAPARPRRRAEALRRAAARRDAGARLRTLMRSVVTSGTGHGARRSPGRGPRQERHGGVRRAAIRRRRTRGSSPRAEISPWPCWSRTASRAAASPHPWRGGSSRRCETSARVRGSPPHW